VHRYCQIKLAATVTWMEQLRNKCCPSDANETSRWLHRIPKNHKAQFTGWPKNQAIVLCPDLHQILTNFFTSRLLEKFAIHRHAHHTYYVATIPCKT